TPEKLAAASTGSQVDCISRSAPANGLMVNSAHAEVVAPGIALAMLTAETDAATDRDPAKVGDASGALWAYIDNDADLSVTTFPIAKTATVKTCR
ncbi:MAG: hypothetical protein ACLFUE_05690, partial [Desulfobacteraceae bacterium]